MEATMETEEVMEEKNPNALVLIDEGKQFAVKTDCMDPEALFLDKKNFVPMLNQVKKIARGLIADVHTEEGFKARKAMNAKLAKLKTAIEDRGAQVAKELKAKPKRVDETRRLVKETLEMLQKEVMAPIREIEARQQEIVEISNIPATAIGCNSEGCRQVLEAIEAHVHDAKYWDESYQEAMDAINDARRQVNGILASAEKQEAEKAELERLRASQADFEKAAREKAEAEKRETEKREAAEAQKLTNVDFGEADAKATREAMLFPDDERQYRRMANREALEDLMNYGLDEAAAKQLVTDIVHGKVRHVRFVY